MRHWAPRPATSGAVCGALFMRTFVALGVAVTAAAALPNAPASAGGLLAPIWSGAYIGLDAGAGWGTVRDATYSQSIDLAGLTGGLHAGYNFQIGNIVLGAEADAMLSGAGATLPLGPASSVSLDLNWAASIRGRLGFAFGPLLLYGTGGVAWSQLASFTMGRRLRIGRQKHSQRLCHRRRHRGEDHAQRRSADRGASLHVREAALFRLRPDGGTPIQL